MSAANKMEQLIRDRLAAMHSQVPGSIGDLLGFELMSCDEAAGKYTFQCHTDSWMRNFNGTLHGGMSAAIVDQAMGFLAHCVKRGDGIAPAIELQLSYHRPLIPGEDVVVKVQVLSVTKSLIRLSSSAFRTGQEEKVCVTATATYFCKP